MSINIIKDFEKLLEDFDYLEEDMIFHEAGETLHVVGEQLVDRAIIINAKLKVVLMQLKEQNGENTN